MRFERKHIDWFAQFLADGVEPERAATLLGFTAERGQELLAVLCRELGPQAR